MACVRAPWVRIFPDTPRHDALSSHTSYTGDEDFSLADAVFDCIGDKGAPLRRLRCRCPCVR